MEKSYRYLGYFFLLFIPLIFFGFYKTYINQFPTFENVKHGYIHVHAAIAILWVALVIVQPFLIVNKKLAWHRKIGKLSYFIFPLLILSFVPSVIRTLNSDEARTAFSLLVMQSCLCFFIAWQSRIAKKARCICVI